MNELTPANNGVIASENYDQPNRARRSAAPDELCWTRP